MAVTTLAKLGEDEIAQQAYARRQVDIYFYEEAKYEHERQLAEMAAEKNRALAEKDSALNVLAEKDAIIAELRSRLGEK